MNKKYLFVLTPFVLSATAYAETGQGVGVGEGVPAEYVTEGARLGGFTLNALVEGVTEYDSNIFRTDTSEKSDLIFHVKPEVELKSNWSRHEVSGSVNGDYARYDDFSREEYEDYGFDLGGRVDVRRDSAFSADIGYDSLHEDRGAVVTTAGKEPVEYDVLSAKAGYEQRFNRVKVEGWYDTSQLDFDDVSTTIPSLINNDDRDRDEDTYTAQLSYEIQPRYDAYLRYQYNEIDYDDSVDDLGLDRSSDGYRAVVGISIDLTGLLVGDFYAGYQEQEYDDAALSNIDDYTAGAELRWNPTSLTTVTGFVDRTIEETTIAFSSGYLSTNFGLRVDHELRRNVLLNANMGYSMNEYEGSAVGVKERDDDIYSYGVGVKYIFNRNLYLDASYMFSERDSNILAGDYDVDTVLLTLGARI